MNGLQFMMTCLLIIGLVFIKTSFTFTMDRHPRHHHRFRIEPIANEETRENEPSVLFAIDEQGRLQMYPVADELFDMSKRGLDLGLGRGYSGNQVAKSQVGLIAANLPHGPGR